MPLFTVTMKSDCSTARKTAFPEPSTLQALLLDDCQELALFCFAGSGVRNQ